MNVFDDNVNSSMHLTHLLLLDTCSISPTNVLLYKTNKTIQTDTSIQLIGYPLPLALQTFIHPSNTFASPQHHYKARNSANIQSNTTPI